MQPNHFQFSKSHSSYAVGLQTTGNNKWKMENARVLELFRILDPKLQKSQVGRGHFFRRVSLDHISGFDVLEPL
jgi:hypothetical protein